MQLLITTVASPGFGVRRGTNVSGCLQEAIVNIIIVAFRLCIGSKYTEKN